MGSSENSNSYHKNLEFTVDKFEDCVPHFLDLEIHPDGLSILKPIQHNLYIMTASPNGIIKSPGYAP